VALGESSNKAGENRISGKPCHIEASYASVDLIVSYENTFSAEKEAKLKDKQTSVK
jgi:hypothetical protein